MTLHILYYDDIPQELETYSQVLERKLHATVTKAMPPSDLVLDHLPTDLDLILIDYELTQKAGTTAPAPYRGGTLASRLAEVYPDLPLVALSRPSIFRRLNVTPEKLRALDDWLFKENLRLDPGTISKLQGLVAGFGTLRGANTRNWKSLLQVMKIRPNEEDLLKAVGPPLRVPTQDNRAVWTVHEAADWIRKIIMAFPGIVYDSAFASAGLGITEDSFLHRTQELFNEARYVGVFGDEFARWWRGRLFEVAQKVIARAGLNGPIPNTFSVAFEELYDKKLEPSKCVFSGEPHADTICYLLRTPVKREYTLEYLPDNRPSVMESARVSFKAIRESNQFDQDLLPASSKPLVRGIRK